MKLRAFFLSALLCSTFFLTGCDDNFVEKTSEALSRGVYAVVDALEAGRIDLATQYSQNLLELVPAPKHRITITPVIDKNGVKYVILGDNLKGTTVIVVGTAQFNQLLKDKVILQKQSDEAKVFADEAKAQAEHNQEVTNKILQENIDLKKEMATYKATIFYKMYVFFTTGWYFWLGGSIIGFGLLCYFCPEMIPTIISVIETTLTIIGYVIGFLFKLAFEWLSGMFSFVGGFFKKPSTPTKP
jgi:hypothetical protein